MFASTWIFIILCSIFQGEAVNTDGISKANKAKYPSPRIIILGMTKVGKSALSCSLQGLKQAECNEKGNKGCFDVNDESASHTRDTCHKSSNYLGDPKKPFTVVDTPGFGDNNDKLANEFTQNIVDKLRDDVEWGHIFLIAVKGGDIAPTRDLHSMITRFHLIFGSKFWSNVMFVVTKGWKHKEIDAEERRDKDEAWMKERWNDIVKKQSGLNIDRSLDIPMVFINAHYDILNQDDPSKPVDKRAEEKFKQYTQELWNKASTIKPFHLIDIKMARTQLNKLKEANQNLTELAEKLQDENKDLEEDKKYLEEKNELMKCSGPLGWITCQKSWVQILGFCCAIAVGFLLGAIVICSCNNPCPCCCACFKNCGQCCRWRCCQTDGGKKEDMKRLVECGLFEQEDYEKLIVKFD